MSAGTARVVWYRLRTTFASRWGGCVGLVLMIGLIGGIAMGSIIAARRTQSSYPAFLASTNASDLTMSTYGIQSGSSASDYSAKLTTEIARLPHVKRVEAWVGVGVVPLLANGALNVQASFNPEGSLDGLYFNQDRVTPVLGRMANPKRVDEFVTTAAGARALGLHVGQTIPMGVFSIRQFNLPGFGTPKVRPLETLEMHLVGIVIFNNQVIEDDSDRLGTDSVFTPALSRMLVAQHAVQGTWYAMQLSGGTKAIPEVEKSLIPLLPSGADPNFTVAALTENKVQAAVKPESIALGAFGVIAALAALAIAALAISRLLRSFADDLLILRALGASTLSNVADGLVPILAAVLVGSLLAALLGTLLTPLSPVGPIRQVFHPGAVAFDWTVLGVGLLVFVGGLGIIAAVAAYRLGLHRPGSGVFGEGPRESGIVKLAMSAGLSVAGSIGLGFALSTGRGRTAVPARSVLMGAVLAVAMVTATLTFSSGLHTLVSRPALYGWNWNYALTSANVVPPSALAALSHDHEVEAWSGYHNLSVQINGLTVPALIGKNHSSVTAPLLSGHSVDANNQVVLGNTTLALLHKRIGDTVEFSFGTPNTAPLYLPPAKLLIVGTATLPAIGGADTYADHPSMGTGALLSQNLSKAFIQAVSNPDPNLNGPDLVFVRLRGGVSTTAGLVDMHRVAAIAAKVFAKDPNAFGDSVTVLSVQRPAEIVNYQSTGSTPVVLAAGLAVGAVTALLLTLVASVRRRRRDLALLKTFGFTTAQLARTIAWQASTIAAIAVIVGVPIGIVVGRQLWILFAREINAVPQPSVPISLFLVAGGALILANVVAAVPARSAARTPAGLVLRTGDLNDRR